MKNNRFYIKLLIVLVLMISLAAGCSKTNTVKPNNEPGESAASETSEAPVIVIDPQADFIKGAKELLSTDLAALLTEKEDGTALVGMLSDFLYDLNNSTAQTTMTLTLSDLVAEGEALGDNIFISLDALHDAKSGDSSMELAAGLGTENALKAGIYVTGDTAVLKPGSASEKIMLYTMPVVPNASNTFLDKASILLTGLFSNDGKAQTLGSNLADRQALCDRYLDPWLTDTKQEDYADSQVTKTLAGKEVPLRDITLNMTGQRAYDFVLGYMQKLQADVQFVSTDKLLGGVMGFISSGLGGSIASFDIGGILASDDVDNGDKSAQVASAVGKLVGDLQALTPEEISAAKFIVSIYFNGDKPIGIDIEASTTNKAFKLGAVLYRSGLEHQLDVHYQYLDGAAGSISLSTVNTGGDNFDVNGKLQVIDATGLETFSGGYTGKLVETADKYDLTGTINLMIQFFDSDNAKQAVTISGDLVLGITHDDTGYTGTGNMSFEMQAQNIEASGLSGKVLLDAKLVKSDTVTITPPLYTESNTTTVTNKQDLWAIHAADLGDMDEYSGVIQDVMLIFAFIMGT
jgi:hypothetical protein